MERSRAWSAACYGSVLSALVIGQEQQSCLDAAADVVDLTQVELQEDRVDVLLDGALGEEQRVRDGRVALSLSDLGKDLELALAQLRERRRLVEGAGLDERINDLRVDDRFAGHDRLDRADQLLAVVDALLEHIGTAGGAVAEQSERVVRLDVLAEDDHADLRVRLAQR